jgi:hypothetical protein
MKLSAYIVKVDSGFSPNPFGRRCTLACCKPAVRRKCEPGDIILGSGSVPSGLSGKLIYAMKVSEVLSFEEYWIQHPSKRPSPRNSISRRGDNIWHLESDGWNGVEGAFHDERHRDHDLSGKKALVSNEFFYFGQDAIDLPEKFSVMLATTQGHKNTRDEKLITRFWNWLGRKHRRGRIGPPMEMNEALCRAQCVEVDDDDSEEDSC